MSSHLPNRLRTSNRRTTRPYRRHVRLERLEDRVVLSSGVVTTAIGEWSIANDHFIEPDGDIVVTGVGRLASSEPATLATVRFQQDGVLDPTFGDGGSITTSIGRADDYGLAVAAYPGQKLVVAGNAYDSFFDTFDADFALARYDQQGDLDTTFGGKAKNAGKVQIDVGQDRTYDLLVQPDGKIISAGCIRQEGGDYSEFALVRYTAEGKLDASFGSGGIVITDIGDKGGFVQAVAMYEGGILAVGHTVNLETGSDFAIARYNLDGELDANFGEAGILVMDFHSEPGWGTADEITALAIDGDRFYVAGSTGFRASETGVSQEVTVARFTSDGQLDPSFGVNGVVSVRAEDDQIPVGAAVADMVLHDGKIVVVGSAYESVESEYPKNFFLARFDPQLGGLDPEFGGGDGWVMTPILVSSEAQSVAIQPTTGKIVVSGYASTGSTNVVAVARYHSVADEARGISAGDLDQQFGDPENRAPVATDDAATTDTVTPVNIDVLANDSDPDGDALTAVLVDPPAFGTVAPQIGGSFTYTPDGINWGQMTFTYLATDGVLESNVATVTISVTDSQNAPPVARDDIYSIGSGQLLLVDAPGVLGNDTDDDGDQLTASLITSPAKGSLVLYHDGHFEYTPNPGIVDTTDQFVYEVSDGNLHPDPVTATVTITITAPSSQSEFSLDDVSKREGRAGRTTSFTFTVTRTGNTTGRTSVHYETEDGTATSLNTGEPGSHDYSAASGVLQFGDGQTAATITVTVTGDDVYENGGVAETFYVNIWSTVGEMILDGQGTGTIINDDRAKLLAGFTSRDAAEALTAEQLEPITAQALALWSREIPGFSLEVQAAIADLPAGQLGETFGNTITLDVNANGAGWYVQPMTGNGSELLNLPLPVAGRVDLLTVVTHEIGHMLGYDHSVDVHDVMAATLPLATRRLPGVGQIQWPYDTDYSMDLPTLPIDHEHMTRGCGPDVHLSREARQDRMEWDLFDLPRKVVEVGFRMTELGRPATKDAHTQGVLLDELEEFLDEELLNVLATSCG